MRNRSHYMLAVLVALVAVLAACGGSSSNDNAANTQSSTSSSSSSSSSSSETTTTEASTPQGQSTLKATGPVTIDISGPGGSCNYFIPGQQQGLVYTVSSSEFPGSGSWDFHIQGDSPDSAGVLLNTDSGSFANDAASGHGTVIAGADLHHAEADLDLVNVANHDQVVHVTATIDCP